MNPIHIINLRLAAEYLATYEGPFNMQFWFKARLADYTHLMCVDPRDISILPKLCKTVGCVHGTCAVSGVPELAPISRDRTWDDYSDRVYGPLKKEDTKGVNMWDYCFASAWSKVPGRDTAKAASERIMEVVEELESLKI